ncbi:MAG: TIR domain-containing protein [Oscillospiraceae bacterium]
MLYDVFISHASEDKDEFVRPLAQKLHDHRIAVWYDEFTLKPGDSIRRSIDIGIAKSRYGIIVLSKAFFAKQWPQWELDGLIHRLNQSECNIIIPIWHNISPHDVFEYSPSLADRIAIPSAKGLDLVASEIMKILRPEGSLLTSARDMLSTYGMNSPLITDDWWLEIAEFSTFNYREYSWGFPFPRHCSKSEKLAWAAMQRSWQRKSKEKDISQISPPRVVLEFIESCPGLEDLCHKFPEYLAINAPQLTIPGFGAQFENDFDRLYQEYRNEYADYLVRKNEEQTANPDIIFGMTTGCIAEPECGLEMALRHPCFGNWNAASVAKCYCEGGNYNAHVNGYQTIDYLLWFLSDQSTWLPEHMRSYILEGFRSLHWLWYEHPNSFLKGIANMDCADEDVLSGCLAYTLQNANSYQEFTMSPDCVDDLKKRIAKAKRRFGFSESIDELYQRFLAKGFLQSYFQRVNNY